MNQSADKTNMPANGGFESGGIEGGSPIMGTARRSEGDSDGIWSILAPVWAVWVILLFVITMLVFFPIFLVFSYSRPDPEKTTRFARIARVWMGVFLPLAGTPLRVRGRE